MLNYKRYRRVPVVDFPQRTWPNKEIEKAPVWCSVDLRDGNQALIEPMVVEEKIEFFNLLVKLGFKEIEIGFPSASQIEYDFLRQLVDRRLIPEDVTVQVLSQCREHLIEKTFESLKGIKRAVVHIYNSTSTLQRDVVFHMSKDEIKQIAIDGTRMVKKYMKDYDGEVILEYSPESFTGTELPYALEVCEAVLDEWGASKEKPVIINLPSTVEMNTPNVYADQIEWMSTHFTDRERVILSIHPHNDRGTAVASAELALLAGADRIEGTLFGNGERTGNVDVLNIAYNMFSQGIDPKLEIENVNEIIDVYERCNKMDMDMRHPYAGKLVFTAFSGSHQDAINKGVQAMNERNQEHWEVPYLPIDPSDLGREYEPIVRINSQSGKGGIAFILKQNFGIALPDKMKEEVGYLMKGISDKRHAELLPEEVYRIFEGNYVQPREIFDIPECHFKQVDGIRAQVTIEQNGEKRVIETSGNGRLDAVSNAVKLYFGISYELSVYEEHAISRGSSSKAAAYVGVLCNGKMYWGVGIDEDIIRSSIAALVSAGNKVAKSENVKTGREERLIDIMLYVQEHCREVTMEGLAEKFGLSPEELSSYIETQTKASLEDMVKKSRLKKARVMLKETDEEVSEVAIQVGYETAEEFGKLFQETYGMTPEEFKKDK